jgi:hypothetical protein
MGSRAVIEKEALAAMASISRLSQGRAFTRRLADEPSTPDVNDILACLLGRLEAALAEIGSTSQGRPLFDVEADLRGKLPSTLPGVRFSAEDIRKWSAEISS